LSILILLIGLGLIFKSKLILYFKYATYSKFKPGDKIYALKHVVNEVSEYGPYDVNLYQEVRPLTGADVDRMDIDIYKKAVIKSTLKSSGKTGISECGWQISADSLCKQKTACIGTCIDYKLMDIKIGNKFVTTIALIIKPNKKALFKDYSDYYKLPADYVIDDGPFYIPSFYVSNQEAKTFRKVK
jgi:hypothetical protein